MVLMVIYVFWTDEDSNGSIDHTELKNCFRKLEISFEEDEINDLFEACDINEDMGITFTEFIVLLCLVYLLKDDSSTLQKVTLVINVLCRPKRFYPQTKDPTLTRTEKLKLHLSCYTKIFKQNLKA